MTAKVRRHGGRGGIGVFFVVIVTLIVLVAFIGIFQLGFSRQVVDQVTRASLGEVCLVLAESATAEALYRIRSRINKPDDEYFRLFRREVLARQSGSFGMDVELKQFEKLLDSPAYRRYYLDDFSIEVAYQKQFSKVPYEKYGVISCTATVGTNLSLTDKVTRTVRTGCEFKVALVGPPRPFDQVSLMVCDASSMIRDANYRVGESVRDLESAAVDRDDIVSMLEGERSSLSAAYMDRAVSSLRGVSIPPREVLLDGVKEFSEPLTVFTVRETVDLERLDLPQRLNEATRTIADLADRYRRAKDRFEGNLSSGAALDAYHDALVAWVRAHRDRISAVRSFQEYFIEYTGTARAELQSFFYKLDEAEWRRKAFYVIREVEGDVNAALRRLKKKIEPLSGVIFVENGRQTLDLEGDAGVFDGNVILVATGNVNIGSSSPAAGGDLLTVVSYGSVVVDGECRASIIANKRVSVGESSRIDGNLVIREVRDFSALRGRIIRDPRLHSGRTVPGDSSGAFIDYYYVAVSPGETFKRIERR